MTYHCTRTRAWTLSMFLGLLAVGCASHTRTAGATGGGVQRLHEMAPDVAWGESQEVNLDGDALMDRVVLGRTLTEAVVGVVLGAKSEGPVLFRLPRAKGAAQGICADPSAARLVVEGRASENDADAPPAAKARTTPGAQGVRLEAGDCDAFHFYFDGADVRWWGR